MNRNVNWLDLLVLRFRAIALRDACACHNLGALLATRNHGESPNLQDQRSAARWYLRAARRGDSEAQYDLAWMLLLGEGVTADREAALVWFTAAAHAGNCEAIRVLADAYSTGMHAVPVDHALAAHWSGALAEHLERHPEDRREFEKGTVGI